MIATDAGEPIDLAPAEKTVSPGKRGESCGGAGRSERERARPTDSTREVCVFAGPDDGVLGLADRRSVDR